MVSSTARAASGNSSNRAATGLIARSSVFGHPCYHSALFVLKAPCMDLKIASWNVNSLNVRLPHVLAWCDAAAPDILALQELVARVPVSDQVLGYAWALVRASRPGTPEAPDFVDRWVNWGAGPRGVLTLVTCAKARAILHGRYHATAGDVQALAGPARGLHLGAPPAGKGL